MFKKAIVLAMICSLLAGVFFCAESAIKKSNNVKVIETENEIVVSSGDYRLNLHKGDGTAELHNRNGQRYTSFPLFAQLNDTPSKPYTYDWRVKGNEIIATIKSNESPWQKIILQPSSKFFIIKFGVKFSADNRGVYIFKCGDEGIESDDWLDAFSPEPDQYFSKTPRIDVRVDRDQQWAFTPAPLNLSFETSAGWFSIGLAQLPPASVFAFANSAIFMDYPWHKLNLPADEYYWLEPIVVTFNESSWNAVWDFQTLLRALKYVEFKSPRTQNVLLGRTILWSARQVNKKYSR